MPEPTFPAGQLYDDDAVSALHEIGLWTGDDLMDRVIKIDDVEEPDFPGYERQGRDVWEDADVIDEETVTRKAEEVVFTCTGEAPGVVAKGYFVSMWTGTRTVLLSVVKFPEPIAMDAAGKRVVVDLEGTAFDTADFGE